MPEDSTQLPRQVGRYPVIGELGRGGMGTVYEGRDPELDRRIAIKVLPRAIAGDPERMNRFKREAKTLAAINHPNIVTLYSVEEDVEVPFLTMELVRGKTLSSLLPEGGLSVDRLVTIGASVAEALAAAHASGVVHRDLKPSNIMVDDEDRIKLLDFGLARPAIEATGHAPDDETSTALTRHRQVMGTAVYMSPEQSVGDPVDVRSDVWSLGVVLYEMATGKRPFGGASGGAIVRAILRDEPTPVHERRGEFPEALARVIRRCLEKEPDDRYPTGSAVVEALRGWQGVEAAAQEEETRASALAVLPFETLGADETSIFAEGVHGDLLTRLSGLSGLEVISRTSLRRYRNTEKTLAEIGRELDAAWVLEGEVQQAADQVQVNVRLVKAPSDRQAWAQRFQRQLTAENLFQIQGEITQSIADALQLRLTPDEKRRVHQAPTNNLAAYHLYVEGRANVSQRTEDVLHRALDCFSRAIEEDDSYALAWAGLADTLSLFGYYAYQPPEGVPEAIDAARRAVRLDPSLGEARASLGIVHSIRREGPAALVELQQAVRCAPSYSEAHAWLAWTRFCLGHLEGALSAAERAVQLDPLSPPFRVYLAEILLASGDGERALAEARRARQIQPDYGLTHFMEGLVLYHLGRPDEAVSPLQQALSLVPSSGSPTHNETWAVIAAAHIARGDDAQARELGAHIDDDAEPFSAGLVHAAVGETDRAFAAFDRVDDWGSFSVDHVRYFFPDVLGPLRGDPRYRRLLGKTNRAWGLDEDGRLPEVE